MAGSRVEPASVLQCQQSEFKAMESMLFSSAGENEVLWQMEVLWTSSISLHGPWRRQAVSCAVTAGEVRCGLAVGLLLAVLQKAVCQHLSFQFLGNILPASSSVLLKDMVGVQLKLPFILLSWQLLQVCISL